MPRAYGRKGRDSGLVYTPFSETLLPGPRELESLGGAPSVPLSEP